MFDEIARNRRRSWLLVVTAFVLLLVVAEGFNLFLGGGPFGLLIALVIAGAGTVSSYYFSDRLALAIAGAREVTAAEAPQLLNVVEEMAIAAGLPMPRVAIVRDPAPNAFATGRDPEHAVVAVTTGLLERLDREELQGVVGHELSHVLNRDTRVTTLVVAVCGAIVVLCDLFWRFSFFGGMSRRRSDDRDGGPLALVLLALGVVALVLAPLGAALIQAAVSRRREALADSTAVSLTRNPAGLRRALEKLLADSTVVSHTSRATAHLWIESPLERQDTGSWLNRMFDTHPPLTERIAALAALEGAGEG
ncbi:MAG TPA: M48 family metalloprotease [Mycobacteriales bacterium]|jgi:heat shock protein HtpX|nr:M48 family metalloprotease [Mycobacteriales bacterium]